ncbi:hypothetical protein Ahy_A08g038119 [Arachis hypogaea]|uniref:Protein FAR1-RELATED SEQUENCE n=1 Tax=Arachis hypogaea TaxID=3818 RepID=A0A445BSM6_ARAHY|nr:hypothetical protein Ahy_A08g038119 [Arachis hypogaea]
MFVRRTIEIKEEAGIRPSKIYQPFTTVAGSHRELSFIEKDVRNYITRKVRNVSEQGNTKEFEKYLLRMKEKNQNFFFEFNLEGDHSINMHSGLMQEAGRHASILEISFHLTPHTTQTGVNYHDQSTLLRCALMKNENIQSFK